MTFEEFVDADNNLQTSNVNNCSQDKTNNATTADQIDDDNQKKTRMTKFPHQNVKLYIKPLKF